MSALCPIQNKGLQKEADAMLVFGVMWLQQIGSNPQGGQFYQPWHIAYLVDWTKIYDTVGHRSSVIPWGTAQSPNMKRNNRPHGIAAWKAVYRMLSMQAGNGGCTSSPLLTLYCYSAIWFYDVSINVSYLNIEDLELVSDNSLAHLGPSIE